MQHNANARNNNAGTDHGSNEGPAQGQTSNHADAADLQNGRDLRPTRTVYAAATRQNRQAWPWTIHLYTACATLQAANGTVAIEAEAAPDTSICEHCLAVYPDGFESNGTVEQYLCDACDQSYGTLANWAEHLGAEHSERAQSDAWDGGCEDDPEIRTDGGQPDIPRADLLAVVKDFRERSEAARDGSFGGDDVRASVWLAAARELEQKLLDEVEDDPPSHIRVVESVGQGTAYYRCTICQNAADHWRQIDHDGGCSDGEMVEAALTGGKDPIADGGEVVEALDEAAQDRLNVFMLSTVDLDEVAVEKADGRIHVSRRLSDHTTAMRDVHDLAREHGLTAVDSRVPDGGDRIVVEFASQEGV